MKRALIGAVLAAGIGLAVFTLTAQPCRNNPADASSCNSQEGCMEEATVKRCREKMHSVIGNKLVCPVMGTQFRASKDSLKSEHKEKVYFFCCPGCKPEFDANPGKYVK